MGWFSRQPLNESVVRKGARLLQSMRSADASVYALRVALRVHLLADADKPSLADIERAIDHLLR